MGIARTKKERGNAPFPRHYSNTKNISLPIVTLPWGGGRRGHQSKRLIGGRDMKLPGIQSVALATIRPPSSDAVYIRFWQLVGKRHSILLPERKILSVWKKNTRLVCGATEQPPESHCILQLLKKQNTQCLPVR